MRIFGKISDSILKLNKKYDDLEDNRPGLRFGIFLMVIALPLAVINGYMILSHHHIVRNSIFLSIFLSFVVAFRMYPVVYDLIHDKK